MRGAWTLDYFRDSAMIRPKGDRLLQPINSSPAGKKRWSLLRAAIYGLVLTGVVVGVQLFIHPSDPWLRDWAYLLGYFLPGPLLFVAIAATRNRRLPLVDEDAGPREWSAADQEEFKRLPDRQRR
jgi:hypothetical protein